MKSPEGLEPIHTRITRFEIATAGAFCDFLSDRARGAPHIFSGANADFAQTI
jgi:hypothetical protein